MNDSKVVARIIFAMLSHGGSHFTENKMAPPEWELEWSRAFLQIILFEFQFHYHFLNGNICSHKTCRIWLIPPLFF